MPRFRKNSPLFFKSLGIEELCQFGSGSALVGADSLCKKYKGLGAQTAARCKNVPARFVAGGRSFGREGSGSGVPGEGLLNWQILQRWHFCGESA